MSDLILLPDVEQLLVWFLLDQPEVTEFFADGVRSDRVYTELPNAPEFPCVRISRFTGSPRTSRPLWLDQAFLQIDVFGGGKRLARDLAETCRAVLDQRLAGVHDLGVVTNVRTQSFAYHPDDTYQPAKPKYDFVAVVTFHPNPGASGS